MNNIENLLFELVTTRKVTQKLNEETLAELFQLGKRHRVSPSLYEAVRDLPNLPAQYSKLQGKLADNRRRYLDSMKIVAKLHAREPLEYFVTKGMMFERYHEDGFQRYFNDFDLFISGLPAFGQVIMPFEEHGYVQDGTTSIYHNPDTDADSGVSKMLIYDEDGVPFFGVDVQIGAMYISSCTHIPYRVLAEGAEDILYHGIPVRVMKPAHDVLLFICEIFTRPYVRLRDLLDITALAQHLTDESEIDALRDKLLFYKLEGPLVRLIRAFAQWPEMEVPPLLLHLADGIQGVPDTELDQKALHRLHLDSYLKQHSSFPFLMRVGQFFREKTEKLANQEQWFSFLRFTERLISPKFLFHSGIYIHLFYLPETPQSNWRWVKSSQNHWFLFSPVGAFVASVHGLHYEHEPASYAEEARQLGSNV